MAIKIKQVPTEISDQLTGKIPCKVYDLPLRCITAGDGLDGITLSGWRFLHRDEDGQLQMAEVAATTDGRYVFKGTETGEDITKFASLYDNVHTHELVQKYNYEVACLRVPACDVTAIWLRGDGHHHELVIPLVAVEPHLETGVFYSPREFVHIIESIVRKRLMQKDVHIASDDLSLIEGIGPKIAELLKQAGIFTFKQLAETDSAKLDEVLREGGPRYNLVDPKTWQQQATLAVDSKWDEFDSLQRTLKGGRR